MPAKRIVLAEYFTTDELTLLFIIRADFEEPKVVEIKTPLEEIRRFVADNFGVAEGRSKVGNLDVDEWHTSFNQFVEPILPWTDEDDIVWLVPHDVLHYLPLHTLKVEGRYLIERNPVCYSPSASVMKYCHAKRRERREKALVIGDSRKDLLHAREEALNVAELFNTMPYLGGQATKSLVKEKLEKERDELDILHFSCHGYFDPYQALKSGIMLAPEQNGKSGEGNDGKWNLTAEEIFGLEMRANLVTLSACESGVNERKPGDELIGLTRSLIYAGTPSVVVSLWAVDDLSTRLVMQYFYQELRKLPEENDGQPVNKVQALQAAQNYVKALTAQQLVDYCDRRLSELTGSEDSERRLLFQLDRANAQTAAGDLKQAIATYHYVQAKLGTLVSEQAEKLANQVVHTLPLLEFKAEEAPPTVINYDVTPFEHLYHWSPFVLVGDWK